MNTYDFLGDNRDQFMKSSLLVYNNLNGVRQYVGKTENEKALRFDPEYAEWFDNTSGVQTLFIRANDKIGLAVDFMFKQVNDPNAIAVSMNTDWDQSDPDYDYNFIGSDPNDLVEGEWRFVGRSVSGLDFIIVIRAGVITLNGEMAIGAPGDFTGIPVTCSAQQDTSVTNKKRDLGYIMTEKSTSGS